MSEALKAEGPPRDPKRPPAPIPPIEPPESKLGVGDYWRFFQNARRNLITAFSDIVYREPIVRRRFAGVDTWIVSEPEAIKRILLDNAENYPKSLQQRRRLEPALGHSILLSEGDGWRWQRRTTAPAFQHKRIIAFAPAMVKATEDMLARWAHEPAPERDIAREMMRLTYDVLSRTVFGNAAPSDVGKMGAAFELYFDTAAKLDLAAFLNLPTWVPTIGHMRAAPALRYMRREIGGAIRERRAELARGPERAGDDLLSMLLTATDPETGRPMDDDLVYDNAITFIGAGHETTANALSWIFFLLSEFPWAEMRVADEIQRVLQGRASTAEDLPNLVYTRQVLEEAMRLYPPAPFMGREAIAADEIGGVTAKPGTQLLVSPWILHRHSLLWDEPDLFDPERFAPGRRETIHRFAYLPFGAGPRICIGMAFAMQEALLLLTTILQHYRLKLRPGHLVEPQAAITLRPKGGLPMLVERR